MTLRPGQRVIVSGAAGTVKAEVLHAVPPGELPFIADAPDVDLLRSILREDAIEEVALIRYLYGKETVCFVALRSAAGWQDLKRQRLTIIDAGGKLC